MIPYSIAVNTKHLYNICAMLDQRRRRWAHVVQMLYKCFVFSGHDIIHSSICEPFIFDYNVTYLISLGPYFLDQNEMTVTVMSL